MPKTTKKTEEQIYVTEIKQGIMPLFLVGKTPLIINRLSKKVQEYLLFPPPKKTAADKAANLKHDPAAEFQDSIHRIVDPNAPTLLAMPGAAPKRAMASAALDMPGMKKAQIGRLVTIPGEYVGVFGTPRLFIAPVRNSDIQHTPDMRTRCIVPEWVIQLEVYFVMPLINQTIVANLANAAGMYIGIGDWRNEKGAGNYGQFGVMSPVQAENDESVQRIVKLGRAVQEEAMLNPQPYDADTADLMERYGQEIEVRGKRHQLQSAAV